MNPEPSASLRGLSFPSGPTVAMRVSDGLRRRSLESVLDCAGEAHADVLLVDVAPGEAVPMDACIPILALTDDPGPSADPSLAGVLPRDASARQIAAAVAAVFEGLRVRAAAPAAGQPETAKPPLQASATPGVMLTPREQATLELVGEGLSNKVIARRLGISAHTVKYHLESVFAKLAVRSRTQAVAQGLRRGLVVL